MDDDDEPMPARGFIWRLDELIEEPRGLVSVACCATIKVRCGTTWRSVPW
jgi:hypothetical protein